MKTSNFILGLILGGSIIQENFVANKIGESIILCTLFGFSLFNEYFPSFPDSKYFNRRENVSTGLTIGSLLLPLSFFIHDFYYNYFYLSVTIAFFNNFYLLFIRLYKYFKINSNSILLPHSVIFSFILSMAVLTLVPDQNRNYFKLIIFLIFFNFFGIQEISLG